MKTKHNDNMKQLSVKVPVEVHKALKIRAAEDGRSVAVIVEGLIRQYLVSGMDAVLKGLPEELPQQLRKAGWTKEEWAKLREGEDALMGWFYKKSKGAAHE